MGLPAAVLARLQGLSGDPKALIEQGFEQPAPVSVRLNKVKPIALAGTPVPHCANGIYLPKRPSFVADPAFHQGRYYVQEASSMMLEQFIPADLRNDPIVALDLCAAPGGKTTHLRDLLHEQTLLVANEVVSKRWNVLYENISKWGAASTCITQATVQRFGQLPFGFDLLLVDAPCSGAGMMRKDEFAVAQWNQELVQTCAAVQQDLLGQAWSLLNPGGVLVYSTCTFAPEENEEQIDRILAMPNADAITPSMLPEGAIASGSGYYCLPHRVRGEGLFMAAVRKQGERQPQSPMTASASEKKPDVCIPQKAAFLISHESVLHAIDVHWAGHAQALTKSLKHVVPGTPVAQLKGKNWQPHPVSALVRAHGPDTALRIVVDKAEALAMLSGEVLRRDVKQGYALAEYEGEGLLWMKGAVNRWNNAWPVGWRIRKHLK